jgi:hypothetical protein
MCVVEDQKVREREPQTLVAMGAREDEVEGGDLGEERRRVAVARHVQPPPSLGRCSLPPLAPASNRLVNRGAFPWAGCSGSRCAAAEPWNGEEREAADLGGGKEAGIGEGREAVD